MSPRIGAWLIDSLILGCFQLGFWVFAVTVGALSIDQAAQQQVQAAPLQLPAVAPYRANLPLLAVLMSLFVVLNVVYAAILWARFRGMPGQKLVSLEVGSAATGRNLSLGRAFVRAVVAIGIPIAAIDGLAFGIFAYETSVPWSDVVNPQPGGPAEAWLSVWSGILYFAILVALAWPVLLLIWTAASATRQGLHDRLAGSLVVGRVTAPSWVASAYGPGYGPGLGPRAAGYGPPPGYWAPPGAWPPGAWPPGTVPPGTVPPDASGDVPGESEQSQPEPGPPTGSWILPENLAGPFGSEESDAPPKLHAATVGRRISAYLIDCVFVYMIFGLTESISAMVFLPSPGAVLDERTFILFGLVGGLEQLAYFTAGWAVWRGTLAQRLLHLQVTDATTGKALSWLDAVVRWAIVQGPFALVTIVPEALRILVILAATCWMLFLLYTTRSDPDLRGLHDRFLDSRVAQET